MIPEKPTTEPGAGVGEGKGNAILCAFRHEILRSNETLT